MTTAAALKASVCQKIDEQSERIIGVGERIMDDPELGFKEHRSKHAGRCFQNPQCFSVRSCIMYSISA